MGVSKVRNSRPPAQRAAFTLIELLVVSSIVGVLAAIMLPAFRNVREQSKRTMCLAHLKQQGVGLFTYAEYFREYGPPVMMPLGGESNRSLIQRKRPDGSLLQHLGLLWPQYVSGAEVFRCPSARSLDAGGKLEHLGALPVPVAGNYTYAVHIPAGKSPRLGATRHLAVTSDNFTQYRRSQLGHGAYAHKDGYNVLYTDASASWYGDPQGRIAAQQVQWDNETDDFTYQSIYDPKAEIPVSRYGSDMDIFRVWYAFCYNQPVSF